jgi:hypothetical protein
MDVSCPSLPPKLLTSNRLKPVRRDTPRMAGMAGMAGVGCHLVTCFSFVLLVIIEMFSSSRAIMSPRELSCINEVTDPVKHFLEKLWNSKQQTANSKQQTANSKQQTANSKQQTAKYTSSVLLCSLRNFLDRSFAFLETNIVARERTSSLFAVCCLLFAVCYLQPPWHALCSESNEGVNRAAPDASWCITHWHNGQTWLFTCASVADRLPSVPPAKTFIST